MPGKSSIGWCTHTWNPTTGCNKISLGCGNCYADPIAKDMQAKGVYRYRNGFKFTIHPESLNWPLTIKTPGRIFVNSMSDLGHEQMDQWFFNACMDTMALAADQIGHIFLILTKRPENLKRLLAGWGKPLHRNIWIGVSVENTDPKVLQRIDDLRTIDCTVRFLSVEPLLAPVAHRLDLVGISWVIVGAESGERRRPYNELWAAEVRDLCIKLKIAFFYKQGSHKYPGQNTLLQGLVWQEFPAQIMIQKQAPKSGLEEYF